MAKTTKNKRKDRIFYRADCLDCRKYVGEKTTRIQAEEDRDHHKSEPNNENHNVEIEVIQHSYLK